MQMSMKQIALFASVLYFVSTYGSTHAEQPRNGATEWEACHSRFSAHIDIIATDAAIDCGFFNLGQSTAQFEAIKFCAKGVLETAKAFKFGHADYGDDSRYCHVAIRDPSGQLWSYFYDEDISGGSGGPSAIDISRCESLTFEPGTIGKHSFFDLKNCAPDKDLNAILGM